jgi:spermidine synthase
MWFSLFVIGFLALLGQVVLLRETAVAAFGIELSYLLALGLWLLGSGLGTFIGWRRVSPPERGVSVLLLIFAALLPAEIALIRGSRVLLGGVTGAYLPFAQQIAEIALAVLPISLLAGLLFQWAAKQFIARGHTLAAAYGIESAGAAVGGLASTLLVALHMQNSSAALLCAFVVALSVAFTRRDKLRIYGGVLNVALLGAFIFAPSLDLYTTRWNHPQLAAVFDTPYSRVAITAVGGQISVYENDALSFETQGTSAEEAAHLAALAHANPQDILVLGGGLEGTIAELLKHAPRHIDYIELNRPLFTTLLPQLPAESQESLRDPRVRVQFGDPRRALAVIGCYDVILIGTAEPTSGQSNRFYTREFFALTARHLNPAGILAFRLRSAENFWPPLLIFRNGSIARAASSVFRDVLVLPGTTVTVLASDTLLSRDPDVLAERYRARNLNARLVTPAYLRYVYTNDRFYDLQNRLSTGNFPANTDARPICYFYATSVWLSKFFPALLGVRASSLQSFSATAILLICAAIVAAVALFWWARERNAMRAVLLAGTAGFSGMLLETLLLLHYQSKSGVLYQNIGLLLTAFMLGLAAGSLLMCIRQKRNAARGLIVVIAAAMMLTTLGFVGISFGSESFSWLAACALLVLSGFFVGALFAQASFISQDSPHKAVSSLYAADLVGGCAGTLLGSLLLIPLAGVVGTGIVVAGASLFMLILA